MNVKEMTINELFYHRTDLQETINLQEAMNRNGYKTPKLGKYWDQIFEICAEIKQRESK